MKAQRIILLSLALLLLLSTVAACSPGHTGGNVIAYIRDGHLWTIDPDGANAFEVESPDTPIIGYAWSPDHHLLVFRTLDSDFAKTRAGQHLPSGAVSGTIGDVPSALNTIGVDGGTPITIIGSQSNVEQSNAWWDSSGDRLLYRETLNTASSPLAAFWYISQSDQPGGIARHLLPNSNAIPSINSAARLVAGTSQQGAFTTSITGNDQQFLISGHLAGHPLSASLERLLWQPGQSQPALLFALEASPQHQTNSSSPLPVKLMLHTAAGTQRIITTCTCQQFAWAPDGQHILTSTGATYTIFDLQGKVVARITGEVDSVPSWSPNGRFLLLDGKHSLQILNIQQNQSRLLLRDDQPLTTAPHQPINLASTTTLLQPLSNSPWSADSQQLVFLTRGRLNWPGQHLKPGLYTASLTEQGTPQGSPQLVDEANDSQPGWTYQQPETSFLF